MPTPADKAIQRPPFDPGKLSPDMKQALEAGMADAWAEYNASQKNIDRGEFDSNIVFGSREVLMNDYLTAWPGRCSAFTVMRSRKSLCDNNFYIFIIYV
jgi:hypothetical protein